MAANDSTSAGSTARDGAPAEDEEAAGAGASPLDDSSAARAVVESLHETLLECMQQADALGFEGRTDQIGRRLDETFDLPFMARMSVGSAWDGLTPAERVDFVALSRRLSAANYAHNFDGFGGERFAIVADEPAPRGTLLVKTELIVPEDDDHKFDYRLRKGESGWRIIDVQLDGKISELTLRRADWRSVIKREGFPQLIVELEQKIEEYAREDGAPD